MVLNIDSTHRSDPKIALFVSKNYQGLCTLFGESKKHVVKTKYVKHFKAFIQNGRTVHILLQEKIEQEINKLFNQEHYK